MSRDLDAHVTSIREYASLYGTWLALFYSTLAHTSAYLLNMAFDKHNRIFKLLRVYVTNNLELE